MKCPIIVLLTAMFFLASCKEPRVTGVNVDIQTNLYISNKDGKNLLDPDFVGGYKKDDIRIYYLVSGEKKEVFSPNLTYPRNFFIAKNESTKEYYIRIFVNEGTRSSEETTTLIQWNKDRTDTLKTLINRTSNYTSSDKIWYNSSLKFDVNTDPLDVYWGQSSMRRFIKLQH